MLLLIIIYLSFISLGLPDGLLGSSWTVMHIELNASVEMAGVIAMIISLGTVVSSLYSSKVISCFGTGKVIVISVGMTAVSLLSFSIASSLWIIVLFSIPLGLGAGAIDAALNNFVALHYRSRHMNWLHCFWGVGAASGPLIIAFLIGADGTWREGYLIVGSVQVFLGILIFLSLPMWKKFIQTKISEGEENSYVSNRTAIKIKGVKYAMLTFFLYCSLESGTGLWAASYLTIKRGILPVKAAFFVSMYYGGITVGRFLSGIIAERVKGENLLRGGLILVLIGVTILLIPFPSFACMFGLVLIGLGCAPIFPSMIHLTKERFGQKESQTIIGLSMASAYTGIMLMPPLLGSIAAVLSLNILPLALLIFAGMMVYTSEVLRLNKRCLTSHK